MNDNFLDIRRPSRAGSRLTFMWEGKLSDTEDDNDDFCTEA